MCAMRYFAILSNRSLCNHTKFRDHRGYALVSFAFLDVHQNRNPFYKIWDGRLPVVGAQFIYSTKVLGDSASSISRKSSVTHTSHKSI